MRARGVVTQRSAGQSWGAKTLSQVFCALMICACGASDRASDGANSSESDASVAPVSSDVPSESPDMTPDDPEQPDGGSGPGRAPDDADAGDAGLSDSGTLDPDSGTPPPVATTKFDDTFGTEGRVLVADPSGARRFLPPEACALTADGATTLGGSLLDALGHRFGLLVRVREDGSLDSAFGDAGIVAENFGMPFGVVAAALVEVPGGGLRVFGHAVDDVHGFFAAQRLASGVPDESFGANGLWRTTLADDNTRDGASVVLRIPGGADDVLVGGWHGGASSRAGSVWRLTSSPSFGPASGFGSAEARSAFAPSGALTASIRGVAVQSTGAIIVTGQYQTSKSPLFHAFVAHLLPDGQLDTTFGSGGSVPMDDGGESSAGALAVLADDRLTIAGYRRGTISIEPTLWRLLPNGTT